MIRYSSEVTIARPPRAVFDALLDRACIPGGPIWSMSLSTVRARPRSEQSRFRLSKGPIKGMLDMELTELDPDHRVVFRVTHPTLDWVAVSTLVPAGTGTRLTYAGDLRLRGWRRLLEPLVGREVRRGEAGEALRLKALLEATAIRPPTPPDTAGSPGAARVRPAMRTIYAHDHPRR